MSEAKVEINKIIDGSEAFRTFINLQLRKTGEFDTDQDVTAENCTQRKEQIQTYRTLFDKLTAAKEALKTLLDERLEHSFKLLEFTGTEDKDKSLAHLMNELDPYFLEYEKDEHNKTVIDEIRPLVEKSSNSLDDAIACMQKLRTLKENTAKATDYNGYMIHHKLSEFESLLGGYYSVVNRKKA